MDRRRFLSNFIKGAVTTTAAGVGINLTFAQKVMAQSSARFEDNKALVCVFLYGGNDSYNMLVPTDTAEYATYQGVRQNLAYARDALLPLNPVSTNSYRVGMPAQASALQQLFEQKKLSIIANIGPMIEPASKQQLRESDALRPPQLFSHNDQQSLWQSSIMDTQATTGWGGRIADLLGDQNDSLPMNMTMFGNNLFQAGTLFQPFSVDQSGPENFAALDPQKSWNSQRVMAFQRLLDDVSHPLGRAYANQVVRAATNNQRVIDALSPVPESQVIYPVNNPLSGQLQMVARLIESQPALGQSRQIYFVGLGGWDTHDNQAELHPQLLAQLGEGLAAFQADLEQRNLAEQVTTFTLSEFGRTLTSNGDGTDHGWAGHQIIMGGGIKGGDIFGSLSELALNSEDDLEDGRMIPKLSIEQMGAALSAWFGLTSSELNAVFPHLSRFDENALQLFV
ncbi:DUF1501 domain-containing protein [Alteromonas sediminis]|uniref:DUF1501 domain-containing protein n=1 Tax=Alteromonas sediminis TaxID=2259342 RepID=A0A3N5Y3T4_9ALTE|nr:DUF1501 domain-containing protein [Alteromonas sediminis]RPJ68642.1 DUF1501 domain-containing protein [Alteromonas sediminis]